MKIQRTLIPTLGMMLALSSSLMGQGVKAGDWDFSIKPRLGYTLGDIKNDLNAQNMLGVGLQGSYGLGNGGSFDGELVFEYYNGKGQNQLRTGQPYYLPSGATTVTIGTTAVPVTVPTASTSVDFRKNTLQGFSLRGGYAKDINATWSWRAGLTIDALQYRQEVSGQLLGTYTDNVTNPLKPAVKSTTTWEGLAYTPTTKKFNVGAYVGMKGRISENFFMEANLTSLGYQNINLVPYSYTGKPVTTTTSTKRGMALEVAFGMKL
jgi:hypothetical protein